MEANSPPIPEDNILLAGCDTLESTTAKLFETISGKAESDDHSMPIETADVKATIPEPLPESQGQLVCVKEELGSPVFVSQTPGPITNADTPQPSPTDNDIEEAIRAQLGPGLICWHEAPKQENQPERTEPTEKENETNETKETAVQEGLFVDALPAIAAADVEGEGLLLTSSERVPQYAWANINDTSELSARIVEEAVDVALAAGQQVANILQASASRETRVNVAHWVKEFDSIKDTHKNFEVHVGVSGATGAGKTTMINALLDFDELLPSGSDGAATATACVVHLNTDIRPDESFRAVIHFKKLKEIHNWLAPIIADVKGYYRSQGMGIDSDDDSTGKARISFIKEEEGSERDSDYVDSDGDNAPAGGSSAALREKSKGRLRNTPVYVIDDDNDEDCNESDEDDDDCEVDASELRDKLKSLTAVFGLSLEDLCGVKVEDLLDRKEHPIIRFLGTTKQIFAGAKIEFAHKIRPYLDCSPLPDDELPSGSDDEEDGDSDSDGSSSSSDADSDNGEVNNDSGEIEADGKIGSGLASMLGRHHKSSNLQVWPLVSHVDLYVPSKLLEGGIVLEDLPGLADQMEERVKVAQSRFRNLDATVIVAPAIRAGDEATCMQLISENEALRMRLDNQLNERTFCVVTSRIDDFDWLKYLRQANIEASSDIGQWCREFEMLRSHISFCEKDLSHTKEELTAGETYMDMACIACDDTAMELAKKACSSLEIRLKELEAQHVLLKDAEKYYRGLLAYHTSQLRNRRVQAKIQEAYTRMRASAIDRPSRKGARVKRAQKKETTTNPDQAKVATLDVLPISALAYWPTQFSKKNNATNSITSVALKEGFPEAVYSGIPALRAWIRYAVVPTRIRHGMSLLRRLDVLLYNLKAGFDMQEPALDKIANPNKFLGDLLCNFQETLILNLQLGSTELVKRMRACNPLQKLKDENKNFSPKCRNDIIEEVKYWDCRNYPLVDGGKRGRSGKKKAGVPSGNAAPVPAGHILGPNGKPAKMAWTTHLAIIRRGGTEYISGGFYCAEYNWIGGLARLALSEVVEQWESCFHHEIPKQAEDVHVYLGGIWSRSLNKIEEVLPMYCSDPRESGYLAVQLEALRAIRDSVIDGVQQAMLKLVEQAKGVHPIVEDILKTGWEKAFREAAQMSGKGSFKMRQAHLVNHAQKAVTKLVKKAIQSMEKQIAANIEAFASQLEELWSQTEQMIQNHIGSMVRKMDPTATVGTGHPNDALSNDRCHVVNDYIFEWETNWKFSDAQAKMSLDGGGIPSTILPEQYLPKPERFDELGLSAADEAEAANDDYNDLGLDEVPGPKRRRKMVDGKSHDGGRGGKGKAVGKGKNTPAKRSKKK